MFDTLGLGLFSTIVASIALQAGCDFYICLLLGVATALFGGVLRDIVCNEIPRCFIATSYMLVALLWAAWYF